MICRWDLWPHMIFLPFMGELFLYQMRETGEFSINMCSGLISPPMSSSSSDRSILHTHHSRVCVCVCVCVCGVPWWALPWGPCRSCSLSGQPYALACFGMASSWNQATSPQRSTHLHWFPHSPRIHAHFYYHIWFLDFTCVCVHLSAQSCPALSDPVDYSPPGSSVHGILQARILQWVAISSSRGSSQPRDRTHLSCVSCIGRKILNHHATWEALDFTYLPLKANFHEN